MTRPTLFIDAQHGLCNRLRAIASAAAIAQSTGRELVVIWVPDAHCEGHLRDIIAYDGPVLWRRDQADAVRNETQLRYNYMEIEEGAVFNEPILEEPGADQGADVFIRAAYTLKSIHRDYDLEQRFLRGLVPMPQVTDLVDSVRYPNDVAVHVRMGTGPQHDHLAYESPDNWPAERHAELTEWRRKSDAGRFLDRLADMGAERVFLAADLPQTYTLFQDALGDKLAILPRDDFDRSARQLQYALADLILLSAADHFLASNWSSFSDVAQRLARPGRKMEQSGVDF